MKRIIFMIMLLSVGSGFQKLWAQSDEVIQLMLNIEKLAQFKGILKEMKNGYDVVSKGYTTVRNLSEGNFNIHKAFIDGLMEASPAVKKYYKVGKIVGYQMALVKEYKSAFNRFRDSKLLNPSEIKYIGTVYSNLLEQSLRNLDELANVVTSGKLQMTDDERLKAIDTIHTEMEDKLSFLRSFNSNASLLTIQRQKEKNEIEPSKRLYNIQ